MIDQPNLREDPLQTTESSQSTSEQTDNGFFVESPSEVDVSGTPEDEISVSSETTAEKTAQPMPDEVIAALSQEIVMLQQQLETERQQGENLKNRYISLAAEFDNFRKRTQKEKQDLETQAKCQALREILTVVDNFERARTQIKPNNEGESLIHNSYQGVYKSLVDSLKRLGVSAMNPKGEPFDPQYHEAMLQEATNDYPEGTVLEQLVRGYLFGDFVLRHALVKVSVLDDSHGGTTAESSSHETADVSAS